MRILYQAESECINNSWHVEHELRQGGCIYEAINGYVADK